ncbi:MAG: NADH-quinone oxidoreductase subunit A [Phycisphaerae bacterium]
MREFHNEPFALIGVVIALVALIATVMLILAHVVGPKRRGPVKDGPYESGMPPIVDTQRRFNVRFYIVAVLFLLFDVEVIFLWPWAQVFHRAATTGVGVPIEGGGVAGKGFLLVGMGIFFFLLVFGLLYEWKKGAFRWE